MKRKITNNELEQGAEQNAIEAAVGLAGVVKDVSYIRREVDNISVKLENDYATKTEVAAQVLVLNNRINPISEALSRIMWIIIGAVLVAALSFVIVNKGGAIQ